MSHQCTACEKEFASAYNLKRHAAICKATESDDNMSDDADGADTTEDVDPWPIIIDEALELLDMSPIAQTDTVDEILANLDNVVNAVRERIMFHFKLVNDLRETVLYQSLLKTKKRLCDDGADPEEAWESTLDTRKYAIRDAIKEIFNREEVEEE